MKLVKYLFLLIFIITAGTATYIALIDASFVLDKKIKIKSPQELVFNQVNHLKNWKNWADTTDYKIDSFFDTQTNDAGARVEWEESESGISGELTHKKVEKLSKITQKAVVQQNYGTANYLLTWAFEKEKDTTIVSLKIEGELDYKGKIGTLLSGKKLSQEIEDRTQKSLEQLESIIKNKMGKYSIEIDGTQQTLGFYYIFKTIAAQNNPEVLAEKRNEAAKELHQFLKNRGIRASGDLFMLYNEIDQENNSVIVSFSLPIKERLKIIDKKSEILLGLFPGREVLKGTLKGDYKNISKLWEATQSYMRKNNYVEDKKSWPYETFIKTNEDYENPAKEETELYIPIIRKQHKSSGYSQLKTQ